MLVLKGQLLSLHMGARGRNSREGTLAMGVLQRGLLAGAESGPGRKPQLWSRVLGKCLMTPLVQISRFSRSWAEKEDEASCKLQGLQRAGRGAEAPT